MAGGTASAFNLQGSEAARHGIAGNQLFSWRRLMAQGALTAAGAGEEVVPVSELRAAHQQIRELQPIRTFSSVDQRRRRCTDVITSSPARRGAGLRRNQS